MKRHNDKQQVLIACLADGKFHSGESLATKLGISRTAVWKRIKLLAELELDVFAVRGKGYRLSQAIDLLNESEIRENLSKEVGVSITSINILPVTESTNLYLFRHSEQSNKYAAVAIAEYQHAGKGRRGNNWVSPYASGLCLSMSWHFDSTPASVMALSLATGVVVCSSLREMGLSSVGLKWPNDIVSSGKKLGGILLESKSESAGACDIVIGIGLNVNLPEKVFSDIEQPITDLRKLSGRAVSRNILAGNIIEKLWKMLGRFQTTGFKPFIEEWRNFDELKGHKGKLIMPNETLSGDILGIDDNGLLLMSINGETRSFSSGELSLRVVT
ncbi:MAG: bifunctional biotin--[acetyl-CoA-carboxylase] ligase/biotin operon repressor BirA [Gammaproteobacteria bacterium]|nr:bifunctional biotin--[acetyl-CoA-carboxylase] ligase/biotin operon repressor BirA [Gammaproteobacteria bacterium]